MAEQPHEPEKIAVSRAEVALLVVLVLFGLSLLVTVERQVKLDAQSYKPQEESYLKTESLAKLEVELATAQTELSTIQAVLGEAHFELASNVSELDRLKNAFPQLAAVAVSPDQTATFRISLVQQCAEALSHVDSTEKLISSFTETSAIIVSSITELGSRLESMDPQSLERLNTQSQLDLLKKELASVQDELVKQQVTLLQQRAELDSLKTFYPQVFNSFSSLSSVSPALPPIVIGDYLNSLSSTTELTNKVARLASDQSGLQDVVASSSEKLASAQVAASRDFVKAEQRWESEKSWRILGWATAGVVLLLVLTFGTIQRVNRSGRLRIRMKIVIIPTIWILAVVAGYQTFGVAGAVVSLVISGLILVWLLRPKTPMERRPEW